jgi:murein DD-endopeptidase MepM/ murein hydrolase activator NlpD
MNPNLNGPLAPSSPVSWLLLRQGVALASLVGLLGGTAVVAQTAGPSELEGPAAVAPSTTALPVDTVPDTMTLAPDALPAAPDAGLAGSAGFITPNEAFIDTTHYTVGATERSGDRPPALSSQAIRLPGSLTGGDGFGIGQTTASGQTYFSAQPNVQYFYNRTLRPPGRIGNGNLRLIFPLTIPAPITSAFGWRIHPISGDQRFHSGTDLGAPMGTPVLAAYAGRVAIADFLGGYGLSVTLDHNQGTQQTLYGHLSEVFVKPGEVVKQGDVIGRVGSTGNSTGPHLHFEFHQLTSEGWLALDPGTELEYSLARFMNAMQFGKAGAAIGSFNAGLTGRADAKSVPQIGLKVGTEQANRQLMVQPITPNQLPTVTVSKTVYPLAIPRQDSPFPGLSNQQLSSRKPISESPL